MFEIFGCFEQSTNFGLAQHYGQFILTLYLRQIDLLIIDAQDFVNGTKTENGVLEKAFGRCFVQVLAMKQIIINELGRECLRALFVVQAQVCQTSRVIAQGAFGLAIDRKTLS